MKHSMQNSKIARQAGFTLVEIMVVVVILGLLAGVGAVAFMKNREDAQNGIAKTRCVELQDAIKTFIMVKIDDHTADDIFDKLISDKRIKRSALEDPWGREFMVKQDDDGNFIVYSKGKNGQEGDDDDVYEDGLVSEGGGGDGGGGDW